MQKSFAPIWFLTLIASGCRADDTSTAPPPESYPSEARALEAEPTAPAASTPAQAPTAVAAPAQATTADKVAATPEERAEQLAALSREYADARNANYKAYREAFPGNDQPSTEALQAFYAEHPTPDVETYAPRARTLLADDPSDATALGAIRWLLENAPSREWNASLVATLEGHHAQGMAIAELLDRLVLQDETAFVRRLLEKSPHVDVRGRACLALVQGLKQDVEFSNQLASLTPEDLALWAGILGAERVTRLRALDIEATEGEIDALLERCAGEFANVKLGAGTKRETTVGARATTELFERKNLAVGKTAPEIDGHDLDGVAFKLSDYRGKVVLLDFWGNW